MHICCCVEWVCDQWKEVFHGWNTIQMESVNTLCNRSGYRKFVAAVRCSGNNLEAVWWSQKYHLSMCGMGLWKSFPWMENYPDGVSEHPMHRIVGTGSL